MYTRMHNRLLSVKWKLLLVLRRMQSMYKLYIMHSLLKSNLLNLNLIM